MTANARVHARGEGTYIADMQKLSWKVEFTRTASGKGKVYEDVPGVGAASDLLLLGMSKDDTLMHDRLSWAVIAVMQGEDEPFQALRCSYVELFIDDAYHGVYLMAEPFDVEREIAAAGGAATDRLYRTCVASIEQDRPVYVDEVFGTGYELFYAPREQGAFDALETYLSILHEEDDERFAERAQAHVDMDSLMRYTALMQGMCLLDNAHNNMYIWAHGAPGQMKLRFLPWDLDYSWDSDTGVECDYWYVMPMADRLLRIDAPGARQTLMRQWSRMREDAFSDGHIETLTAQYAHELNDSGAYRRNAQRWGLGSEWAEASLITLVAQWRFSVLDERIAAMTPGTDIDFLTPGHYSPQAIVVRMNADGT